jgi:diaminopimelate epimerase
MSGDMQLTKHHGLGNDFLVVAGADPDPAVARAVCHRHRGVGADGLLVLAPAEPGRTAIGMVLFNADGSRAEMSGNGIGCLAQAAVRCGLAAGPEVQVHTGAGLRTVHLAPTGENRTDLATVSMGVLGWPAGAVAAWVGGRVAEAVWVDVGNPHLVLLARDPVTVGDRAWLADVGAAANAATPGGVNVEVVAAGDGAVTMDVFERGVGLTDACGTGAVAAAAAARRWGIAGDRSTVTMHGGSVDVAFDGDAATLATPITYVATVDFPWP